LGLILFVSELGSGFGHVRRLLPCARAAACAGHEVQFLVSNPEEAAPLVRAAGFRIESSPRPRQPRRSPPRGAVATSFADILGGAGFSEPELLRDVTTSWDAALARLRPLAVVCEASPFLNLACFAGELLVKPGLLNELVRAWASNADVLLIGTLGLFGWQAFKDLDLLRARFQSLSPGGIEATIDSLEHEPAWCDRRRALFSFAGDDLSRLPAPWLLAWTSALGVPRRLFDAVGGFDETFLGWGGEDCDFAWRMHREGASFRAFTESLVLHLPHPTEPSATRRGQHLENARALHEKCFGRETEMFAVLGDPFAVNTLAMRLDRAALPLLSPRWDDDMTVAARRLVGALDDVLVVGAPEAVLLAAFPGATWVVPNRSLVEEIARMRQAANARCSVGCALEEPRGARDVVVLTDLLRLMPAALQKAQLREAVRVGKRAYLLCSGRGRGWPDGASVRREIEGFPLLPIERLPAIAAEADITLTELPEAAPALRAYELSSCATGREFDG
jgi:hypothetical protein